MGKKHPLPHPPVPPLGSVAFTKLSPFMVVETLMALHLIARITIIPNPRDLKITVYCTRWYSRINVGIHFHYSDMYVFIRSLLGENMIFTMHQFPLITRLLNFLKF
jgi:hypothetical protein